MFLNYKIGCNFKYDLIEGVCKLNELNPNTQIKEMYGSIREHDFLTARPGFRIPEVTRNDFRNYIKECNRNKIQFNYTFNTIYPGSKKVLNSKYNELVSIIKFIEDSGVKKITVANPIVAEIIKKVSPLIDLEVSTVAQISAVTQIKVWKNNYNIKSICNHLGKNRSIKFLKNSVSYCSKNDIELYLIVNEFCGNSGGSLYNAYGTDCIHRTSCYLCHSENSKIEDVELFNSYPTNYCTSSKSDFSAWLKTKFIRPEDIIMYSALGIHNFKIVGRTGGTNHILKIAKAYIDKSWKGNLLGLGKQVDTVFSEDGDIEIDQTAYINNKKLNHFLDHWFKNINFDCENELCGDTCRYCNDFYYSKVMEDT